LDASAEAELVECTDDVGLSPAELVAQAHGGRGLWGAAEPFEQHGLKHVVGLVLRRLVGGGAID
jgi:hypothetical protein